MNNIDMHYVFHGLMVLLIGLLGGYFFARAISVGNNKEDAWRVVHSGANVGGVALIAIGAVINRITIPHALNVIVFVGIVVSTYLLVVAMVMAAVTGERGLGNVNQNRTPLWRAIYFLYSIGGIVSMLSFSMLAVLWFRQLFR